MHNSVIETHPRLWHYTTASGLHGILNSQQLWATHIHYLNDAEEFSGFFDRKLLHLLKEGVQEGIAEASKTPEGLKLIKKAGGKAEIEKNVPKGLLTSLRETTLSFQVYITSFCSPSSHDSEDGLLSQWRGYGTDGGYAIVFDTQALNELFIEEMRSYFYSYGLWGDVDYFDGGAGTASTHKETLEWEADIRKAVADFIFNMDPNRAEPFFEPILSLAMRHKHRGFREESEVRFSAVTAMTDNLPDGVRDVGDVRPKKDVHFVQRGGILVPYISLFERPNGEKARLPIKTIVVGPHPEKLKRKIAIEKLLDQLEIQAKVIASDIPYLGRSSN